MKRNSPKASGIRATSGLSKKVINAEYLMAKQMQLACDYWLWKNGLQTPGELRCQLFRRKKGLL